MSDLSSVIPARESESSPAPNKSGVNWQHVESVLRGSPLYRGTSGDRLLLSSAQVAFAVQDGFLDGQGRDLPSLSSLWSLNAPVSPLPLAVGQCGGEGIFIARSIGPYFVAERFVRCFAVGVTWTVGTAPKQYYPLLVHYAGELLAMVMPVTCREKPALIPDPTDEQVFSPFATEQNGYYLQSDADLHKAICHAEQERCEAQERADEAEAEVKDWDTEIKALYATQRARRAALPICAANSKADAPKGSSGEAR